MKHYTEPLRYWCHKILPLVYDDSLSYYEVLCKVSNKINELIDTDEHMQHDIKVLFDRTEGGTEVIKEKVRETLEEWKEDGTLGEIITEYLNANTWVSSGDFTDEYRNESLACLASMMVHNVNCLGKEALPGGYTNLSRLFYHRYSTARTWEQATYISPEATYNTQGTQRYNGVVYPAVYDDCITFVSMLCMNREWRDRSGNHTSRVEHPNHYALTASTSTLPGTDPGVLRRCSEGGDWYERPWTMDFLNTNGAALVAKALEQGGCKRTIIARKANIHDDRPVFIDSVVADAKTGDLVFFEHFPPDSDTDPDYERYIHNYKQIGHVGYYVKTLEELDEKLLRYNAHATPIENEHPEYGYICHMVGRVNQDGWRRPDPEQPGEYYFDNEVRFETLYSALHKWGSVSTSEGSPPKYQTITIVTPKANPFTSNKSRVGLTGRIRNSNGERFSIRRPTNKNIGIGSLNKFITDNGYASLSLVGHRTDNNSYFGPDGTNGINTIENGIYVFTAGGSSVWAYLYDNYREQLPESVSRTAYYTLMQFGGTLADGEVYDSEASVNGRLVQVLWRDTDYHDTTAKKILYIRFSTPSPSAWSPWFNLLGSFN